MKISQKDKLENCYFVKNVLMCMVVFYHSIALWMGEWFKSPQEPSYVLGSLALWLNSFHIYGFMLVSGYIYYYMRYEKKSRNYMYFCSYIKIKAKRLLIPYSFVALVWVMPIYCYFNKPTIDVLIKKYILMESPSQLWFLVMLFGCSAVFYLLSDYVRLHTIAGGVITLLFWGLGIVGVKLFGNYFQIWNICKYLIFFYIGFILRQYDFRKLESIPSALYVAVDIVLFEVWNMCSRSNLILVNIMSIGLFFSLNIIGSIGSFVILQKFASCHKKSMIRDFLSKHNMTIYLFHQQLIYFVIVWGNGKVNNYLLAVMNFAFSFLGALIISIILSLNKGTRFLISGKSA